MRVGGDAHLAGPAIVHHNQLEHAGGLRQRVDRLDIALAIVAHRGVRPEHQRAHAHPADHLSQEEPVGFRRERQRVADLQHHIHTEVPHDAQPLVHAGQRLHVHGILRQRRAVVFGRIPVHQSGAWVEQHHHAFDRVRTPQNRVRVLDAAMSE